MSGICVSRPDEESGVWQTRAAGGKKRAAVKKQYGTIHHGQIVEKWEGAGAISGNPDDAGNQHDVETDLGVGERLEMLNMR